MQYVFYAGIGMLAVGYFLLQNFGISRDEMKSGEEYTTSDNIGSVLLLLGLACLVVCGVWTLGVYIVEEIQHLFYGTGSAYAPMDVTGNCATACAVAAFLFFLSMMTSLRAEAHLVEWRRRDPFRSKQGYASLMSFAGLLHRTGVFLMLATVGIFLAKRL